MIDTMSKSQMNATKSLVNDFLNEKYKLPPKIKKKLKRDKKYIFHLVDEQTPFEEQKAVLKQKGGFLQFLLPLAATVIPAIIKGLGL